MRAGFPSRVRLLKIVKWTSAVMVVALLLVWLASLKLAVAGCSGRWVWGFSPHALGISFFPAEQGWSDRLDTYAVPWHELKQYVSASTGNLVPSYERTNRGHALVLPLWTPVVAMLGVWAYAHVRATRLLFVGPRCDKCGYSRAGLAPGAACPECGQSPNA